MSESKKTPPTFLMLFLLCFFFGFLGIHRYYMGYKYWWVQLITFGGFFVWALFDLINLATGKMKMADGSEIATT